MIIDTSAIIAVIRSESESTAMLAAILATDVRRMSAATYLESAVVVERGRDPVTSRLFDDMLERIAVEIVPVTETQAKIARRAYWDYGKGSGHKAGLNFGDCFSYALARDFHEPLLYKGDDFPWTDITSALPSN